MIRPLAVSGLLLMAFATVQAYVVRDRVKNLDVSPQAILELKARLDQLPKELGDGRYRPAAYELDPEVVRKSGADTYAARGYRSSDGHVYRVYLGGAIRNRESFHAPNVCMPAAGWEILSESSVDSPMRTDGARIRRLLLRQGDARMLVYYWFQCGSRQADHDLVARWYRFVEFVSGLFQAGDESRLQPTMIATIYVPFQDSIDHATARSVEFMQVIGPALTRAVSPKEK